MIEGSAYDPTVGLLAPTNYNHLLEELSPQESKVMECLIREDMMLRPYEIGELTDIPPKSVSARLSKLKDKNRVLWNEGGYYTYNPLCNPTESHIQGGSWLGCGWCVQNVHLYAMVSVGCEDKYKEEFGDVRLSVTFGSKRDKVSVVLLSNLGLDYSHWLLVLDKVDSVCSMRGFSDLMWYVSMCEVLRDYDRKHLDGVSGYTLTRFMESVIEKIRYA